MGNSSIEQPDEITRIVYLEVPPSKVVLLQAYFELYECLGVVRTLSVRQSLVCIMTTASVLAECLAALESMREGVGWRFAPLPPEKERLRYLGYFSNAKNDPQV